MIYHQKKYNSGLSVSGVLGYLNLSRSGYIHYRNRRGKSSTQAKRKEEIKKKISQIHSHSKEIYGAPKIREELCKQENG
ncbi:MAG TPA: hypothetical protein GXZ43_03060 [Clostridiaceae bacterium]|nr:hypothetical protein [Clostridiaceae bacterium]